VCFLFTPKDEHINIFINPLWAIVKQIGQYKFPISGRLVGDRIGLPNSKDLASGQITATFKPPSYQNEHNKDNKIAVYHWH